MWHPLDNGWVKPVAALEKLIATAPWSEEMLLEERKCGSWQQVLIAEDGTLGGYVVSRPQYDEWHIMTLGVTPHCRRQGLGRRLVQGVIGEAKRTDSRGVVLEVRVTNFAARTLYHAMGFELLAIRRGYYQTGPNGVEDAVVMACWIK